MKRSDLFSDRAAGWIAFLVPVVLLLPCGRSAHLEAGWALGRRKPTCIVLGGGPVDPELMYLMADYIAPTAASVFEWLDSLP